MNWKGTKGVLEMKFMPGGICIGIGTVGNYCQITANSILPETDEEYEKEKEELEANMRLYAASRELLKALQIYVGQIERSPNKFSWLEKRRIAEKSIEKALK